MSVRPSKSGLSRDCQAKLNAKYDPELAQQCLEWAKGLVEGDGLDASFDTDGSPNNFYEVLKNGTVLGRLVNALIPGSIPASKIQKPSGLAFKQMELIGLFIDKCKEFGVLDHECFQTVDLYEQQNLFQVTVCLLSLGRKAKAKGLKGFGPKEADANKREFTAEQLKAGSGVIGLQMGSNKGASQAGMNFGKSRMILD